MRDDSVGFPAPGEVQPQVSWTGRGDGSEPAADETSHDSSSDLGKFGEIHRDHH